jgi:hypothetical protein
MAAGREGGVPGAVIVIRAEAAFSDRGSKTLIVQCFERVPKKLIVR